MNKKVTAKDYLSLYLQTMSLNLPKDNRLNHTEVKLLVELCFFSGENLNPYTGRGREILMNDFQFNQQRCSALLKSLCDKKFLIKMNNGEYVINLKLQDLVNSIEPGKKLMISHTYEIIRSI